MDEQKFKTLYMHTVEYYSTLDKKEILKYATTWMNLEDIMRTELSQSQKDKHCMIPVTWGIYSNQTHRRKEQNGGCQKQGEGKIGVANQHV